jgi:Red chlorophyll catabolite reductase (RCC reductase)
MSETGNRTDNLKSVIELIEERPTVDNSDVFERLKLIQTSLWAKIENRFPDLILHASTTQFQPYQSLDGNAKGNLKGFTSSEIEWAVCSWVGNPKMSFCNLHITIWMKEHTYLPHLVFACGTFPVLFFLLDYIPRVEPTVNPDYMQKYLEPSNERFLQMQQDKRFMPFISQSAFVRFAVSAIGMNFISPPNTVGTVERFEELAHEHFDRWLGWSKESDEVASEKRSEIAARDLAIRRNTAELDPANVLVEKIYGKELVDDLVKGLWGGIR